VEAAAADGAEENLPLRLGGWPRSRSATLPQVSLRALEIADAIPTATWKTLRVFHSSHRPGDEKAKPDSHLRKQAQEDKTQGIRSLEKRDISNELRTGTFLTSLDSVSRGLCHEGYGS